VTFNLTGTESASTLSDGSGNYQFALASGGTFTVTPNMAARVPGSSGINTLDVIATQRHFLNVAPLTGCRLTAADVNGDTAINTLDVVLIQRFFLGFSGSASVGKCRFTPTSRTYTGIVSDQTNQNYDALVFGDVASPFAARSGGSAQDMAGDGTGASEVPSTVAAIALPIVAIDQSKANFIAAVTTSAIDPKNNLVGFQGDFSFDERVITFQSPAVEPAGLTSGGWNVSGNIMPGTGPIRTLRISAFSNDFRALSGSGTLFELKMTRGSGAAPSTQMFWAAPPDHFIFIDADLNMQKPIYTGPGSVTFSEH
jgi:Dockerin type I domain